MTGNFPKVARPGARRRIGEMLIGAGVVTKPQLDQALSMAQRTGERVGQVLVKAGFARPEQIARALSEQFGITFVPPSAVSLSALDREAAKKAGLKVLQETHVVPVKHGGKPYLMVSDPLDTRGTDRVEALIGKRPYACTTLAAIDTVLQVLAFETVDAERIIESARESIDQGEIQALLEYILGRAVLEKASDVHLEPTGLTTVVRYRIDGQLKSALSLPRVRHQNLANVIFSKAGVDISDFQRLHDGRFSFEFANRRLDIRFASSPSVEGPMIVLRILDDSRALATLEELGYAEEPLERIGKLLRHPFGLILVVGPTGSGKTTTLYSCLTRLNDGATKILTVEDPVEIRVPSIQQVQVNDKAGVTFSRTIRAFLRQDPDVILVGEIRDEETAREAFRAANTGHLVLSTLHANSAAEAVSRLLDLGMDAYQVAGTLLGSISQRLLRTVCPHCSTKEGLQRFDVDEGISRHAEPALPEQTQIAAAGPGCERCNGGHAGRTIVTEVLEVDESLRELIHGAAPRDALIAAARKKGFRTMADGAFAMLRAGKVSLEEAEGAVGPLVNRAALELEVDVGGAA